MNRHPSRADLKAAEALMGGTYLDEADLGAKGAKQADRQAQTDQGAHGQEGSGTQQDGPGYSEYEPHDPLADLVQKSADDPGAPFAPDFIDALAELRANDRGAFEQLRARLKSAKVRVTALDQAINQAAGTDTERQTQADLLLAIAGEADLFHTSDKTAFADIKIAEHRETWPVRSKGFRRWLGRAFYEKHGGAPNGDAVQSALGVIEAKAHYDAPERQIFLRIGEHDGRLYLDLGDETWGAIEIEPAGWRVVADPPVRFRRAAGMLPLPVPVSGGSISQLRELLNVGNDQDFHLAVAWLLAAFRPRGPYPALVLSGEQGSAKTSFARILRYLIDPNAAPQRSLPREDRDMFIAANNGHVLSFDNVSGLPAWISDTLCRLSTGGGFAVRTLYSDADETLFDAMRPIVMTGIEDVVSRPDLAERSIFLSLVAIPDTARKTEKKLDADLEASRSGILGALLDAVSTGLRRLPDTWIERLPRMADFALWATACGDGKLWPNGGFMLAHDANRANAVSDVIEADPVAAAIRSMMRSRYENPGSDGAAWSGTAHALNIALQEVAGESVTRTKHWPNGARALSGRVTRAATFLRSVGIDIVQRKSGDRLFLLSVRVGIFAPFAPVAPKPAENHDFSWAQNPEAGRKPDDLGANRAQTGRNRAQMGANDIHKNPSDLLQSGAMGAKGAKNPTQSDAKKKHSAGGWL